MSNIYVSDPMAAATITASYQTLLARPDTQVNDIYVINDLNQSVLLLVEGIAAPFRIPAGRDYPLILDCSIRPQIQVKHDGVAGTTGKIQVYAIRKD